MTIDRLILTAILIAGCSSAAPNRPALAAQPSVERGVELYEQRDFGQAARVLEQATAARPKDARAWTYLGLTRLELKQPDEAAEAFRKALEIDGDSSQAHYGLGLALGHLRQLDAAVGELERAIQLDSRHAYAHYHLGLAYNQQGRKDRALLHLQRFLELEPDAPEAARVQALLADLR